MTATFAALETRLNTAIFSRLSNVTATLAGREVTGIFDNGYATALVGLSGMAGSQPVWVVATSTIPPIVIDWFLYFTEPLDPLDLLVTLNDVLYKVVAHEPDGTGMSRLVLELA
jgi:hypothetical protein